jgi:hypothetical protein
MIEPIYAALERGEKLNIYFELAEDFHGLDSGALWQDVKAAGSVGLKHRSSWERWHWSRIRTGSGTGRAPSAGSRPANCVCSSRQSAKKPAPGSARGRPLDID